MHIKYLLRKLTFSWISNVFNVIRCSMFLKSLSRTDFSNNSMTLTQINLKIIKMCNLHNKLIREI